MAGDQDPSKKPPEGTPSSEVGETDKKLFFKKYETKEEAEKAWEERDKKFTEGQQELADAKRELELERQKNRLVAEKQEGIRKAQTEEEKQRLQQELDQNLERMGKEFAEESKKGPKEMMRGFHRLFDAYVSTQGFVKRGDLKRQSEADRRQTDLFNRVKAAHKEDFEELAPKMAEIWEGLSPQTKMLPSEKLLETVYQAAKAESLPDEAKIREKIIADMRAGHGEGGGEKLPPEEKKSEDDKYTDDVIKEYKKTKVVLSEQSKGD